MKSTGIKQDSLSIVLYLIIYFAADVAITKFGLNIIVVMLFSVIERFI